MGNLSKMTDKHEADLARIRSLRLLDDDFLNKCFEDNIECVELVLRIIMDIADLKVQSVQTQYTMKNLQGRSLRLDILAADDTGKKYNVEIQRDSRGAGARRARYHSSMLDANILSAGDDFEDLPETYVIFITEKDHFRKGKPLYRFERYSMELDKVFGDGSHILYVNAEYRDDTPLGRLMYDFSCTDPADMHYAVLADRARYFKEEEGLHTMSKILEEMRLEEREEGRKEGIIEGRKEGRKEGETYMVRNFVADGTMSLEKIAEISGFTYDEVKAIAEEKETL